MTTLDTLIYQCTAVLADTPDAVLSVRADELLVHLEALQEHNAELPRYRVGDMVRLNGDLVRVYGVVKAANPNDRYWYRVGTQTARTQVREGVLRGERRE